MLDKALKIYKKTESLAVWNCPSALTSSPMIFLSKRHHNKPKNSKLTLLRNENDFQLILQAGKGPRCQGDTLQQEDMMQKRVTALRFQHTHGLKTFEKFEEILFRRLKLLKQFSWSSLGGLGNLKDCRVVFILDGYCFPIQVCHRFLMS